MKHLLLIFAAALALFATSCKSGKKALEKGDYDKAVFQSTEKLRKSPNNDKAKATLKSAYPNMLSYTQDVIVRLKQSSDSYRWEKVMNQYATLNRAYDEIKRSPAAMSVIKNPKNFQADYEDAKRNAAETRFVLGQQELDKDNREAAKVAFEHFMRADEIYPNYRGGEARNKAEEARAVATVVVVVQPIPMHSQTLALSNGFFESQMIEYMKNGNFSPFVQFYSAREAEQNDIQADHLMKMIFDDFVVGQAYVKETVETCKQEGVVVGEIEEGDSTREVLGEVSAEMHRFRKAISSQGLLDFQIINAQNFTILSQQKFPGSFVWENEWGFYNGDERALSDQDYALSKQRELPAPPPQDLFIEFTKPIFDQVTRFSRDFYRNY